MTMRFTDIQQQIIDEPIYSCMQIFAAPGMGVDEAIAERIARYLKANPRKRVWIVTVTDSKARYLSGFFKSYSSNVTIFTVEELALRYLRGLLGYRLVSDIGLVTSTQEKIDTLSRWLEQMGIDERAYFAKFGLVDLEDKTNFLTRFFDQVSAINQEELAKHEVCERLNDPALWALYNDYQDALETFNLRDRDNTIQGSIALLRQCDRGAWADRVRWPLFYVFEADKLTNADYTFLYLIRGINPLDKHEMVMVGERHSEEGSPDAGESPFEQTFKRDFNPKVFEFTQSLDVSQAVVDAASALQPNIEAKYPPLFKGEVSVHALNDEAEEVQWILNEIARLQSLEPSLEFGGALQPKQIAILARNKSSLMKMLSMLENKGVSLQIANQLGSFEPDAPVGKAILYSVRIRALTCNDDDRKRLIQEMGLRMDVAPQETFFERLIEALQSSTDERLTGCLTAIKETLRIKDGEFDLQPMLANVERELIEAAERKPLTTDERFFFARALDDITSLRKANNLFLNEGWNKTFFKFRDYFYMNGLHESVPNKIFLSTFPTQDLLKRDVVFVMGMTEGECPSNLAKDEHALEKEKQYLIRTILTSRRRLYFTYPKTRLMPWGEVVEEEPSRFLKLIQ